MDDQSKGKKPRGPEPVRLVVEGGWEAAVAKSLQVKKPECGWPKPKPRKKRRKS